MTYTAMEPDLGAPPALSVGGVSKRFGGVRALQDVDFEVAAGEVHCLAGENGSGKSTLIKIVSGVYAPDRGARIAIAGRACEGLSPVTARQLGVQVIWQDLALFPHLSVAENVAFEQNLGGLPRWVRHGRMRAAAQAVLDRLGVTLDLDRPVHSLSIAQRQVVAICRALVAEARIVFMDEPTASLTQAETDALIAVVRRLSAQGIAVVFVSHRLAEVLAVSSRVTVLRDGRKVGVFPSTGMTQARLTELMTGKTLETTVHAREVGEAPVVLETRGLTRRDEYEDVSIVVRRGEIVGLTGLLGAGRTELAATLFGLTRADRGEVLLNGEPVRFRSNRDAIRAGIGYVSEDRLSLGLVQPQSIADNIVAPVLDRIAGRAGLLSSRRKAALVRHWVDRLAIKIGRPEDAVATLSGGNQQRVVLAKWLATEPSLLILDSPTVGVDVGARAGIFDIVRDLAAAGVAILLISDEIPEAYHNADRVLHMRAGRIVGEYRPGATAMPALEAAVHA
ncbi:MAG: sugar ABC transporter ATP-binding protein [Alphaproteobacteria bacterium]